MNDALLCSHPNVTSSCTLERHNITWCLINPGCYSMGSPISESCHLENEDLHNVVLTNAYHVSSAETTVGQFKALMGYEPATSGKCGDSCPVEKVSWHESVAFCNALSRKEVIDVCYGCSGSGKNIKCNVLKGYTGGDIYKCRGYRLPTEAEWEYAYRGGTQTALYNGQIQKCIFAQNDLADKIAWYFHNTSEMLQSVKQKSANMWGLYDMAGNVSEWCHDTYKKHLGFTKQVNPVVSTGEGRVIRGGSIDSEVLSIRAAARVYDLGDSRWPYRGFRCIKTTN